MRSVPSSGCDKCSFSRYQRCSRSSFSSTSAVLFCRNLVRASCLTLKNRDVSLVGFLKKKRGIVLKLGFLSSSFNFSSSSNFKNSRSASLSFSAALLCSLPSLYCFNFLTQDCARSFSFYSFFSGDSSLEGSFLALDDSTILKLI